jgi:hypothetical protein
MAAIFRSAVRSFKPLSQEFGDLLLKRTVARSQDTFPMSECCDSVIVSCRMRTRISGGTEILRGKTPIQQLLQKRADIVGAPIAIV